MRFLTTLCLIKLSQEAQSDQYNKICNVKTCTKCDKYVAKFAFRQGSADRAFQFCSNILRLVVNEQDCCDKKAHIMQFGFSRTNNSCCSKDDHVVQYGYGGQISCVPASTFEQYKTTENQFKEIKQDIEKIANMIIDKRFKSDSCGTVRRVARETEEDLCTTLHRNMMKTTSFVESKQLCSPDLGGRSLILYGIGMCCITIAVIALAIAYFKHRNTMMKYKNYTQPSESAEKLTLTNSASPTSP